MATFNVTVTGSSDMDDVVTQLNAWAAQLNGQLNNDNFDSDTFTADVSDISDAADTKGCTFTGNIACDDGITVDGQDVSELGATVTTLQTTVNNEALTKTNMIIYESSAANGADLYSALTTAQPSVSSATHDIYYSVIGFTFNALSTDSEYTLGNISAWIDGSTAVISGTDRNGLAIDSGDMTLYWRAICIPQ